MRLPRQLTILALALVAVAVTLPADANAGVDPGLCGGHSTAGRVNIPANFYVDACFTGSALKLRNNLSVLLSFDSGGSVGKSSRTSSDFGLAALAERASTDDPDVFLPGDTLTFPVGSGSGKLALGTSSDEGFYDVMNLLQPIIPAPTQQVASAVAGFVHEVDDDFAQYQTCITGKNFVQQLGCKTLLVRNTTFAVTRGTVDGGVAVLKSLSGKILGVLLSAQAQASFIEHNVKDTGSLLHGSGVITISAAGSASTPMSGSSENPSPSPGGGNPNPPSGGGSAPAPAGASLGAGQFYVQNASGGIYWRSSPDWNTPEASAGNGFYPGTIITVSCYQGGAGNVPGSADTMWEQASWAGGPGRGSGWINEHYINDGSGVNQPSPGISACQQAPAGSPSPTPDPTPAPSNPTPGSSQPSAPAPTGTTTSAYAPTPAPAWSETVGGPSHTWTDYANAGGNEGPTIPTGQPVQIACKLPGFRVADGDTWWYRIASAPWNGEFYVSADAFYNNGQTSGSLHGTPYVDQAVADC